MLRFVQVSWCFTPSQPVRLYQGEFCPNSVLLNIYVFWSCLRTLAVVLASDVSVTNSLTLLLPLAVATTLILTILLVLCIIYMFPYHRPFFFVERWTWDLSILNPGFEPTNRSTIRIAITLRRAYLQCRSLKTILAFLVSDTVCISITNSPDPVYCLFKMVVNCVLRIIYTRVSGCLCVWVLVRACMCLEYRLQTRFCSVRNTLIVMYWMISFILVQIISAVNLYLDLEAIYDTRKFIISDKSAVLL